jgi:hypothetical protein
MLLRIADPDPGAAENGCNRPMNDPQVHWTIGFAAKSFN